MDTNRHEFPRVAGALPFGEGIYRRRLIAWTEPGAAHAAMEDDLHHIRVHLRHDGVRVTEISGDSRRIPYISCPGAAAHITDFLGTPLDAAAPQPKPVQAHNCTHMLDVARLAIGQMRRGGRRRYDISIPDRVGATTTALLERDGAELMRWELDGSFITGPAEFAGHQFGVRAVWPAAVLADPDLLEAALILRRGVLVSSWREAPFAYEGAFNIAADFMGACHTFQVGRYETATRHDGHELEFTHRPEALLADLL